MSVLSMPQGASPQVSERVQDALADLSDGMVAEGYAFAFRGCPDDDPDGRVLFESVSRTSLLSDARTELIRAYRWNNTYPDCGYEPLNDWFTDMFRAMHAERDQAGLMRFIGIVSVMHGSITEDLQEAMYDAAEDADLIGREYRERLVWAAFFSRQVPAGQKIEEGIAALRRPMPGRETIAYQLGRTHGAAFFEAMARAAPTFPERDLSLVARAIGSDIRDGRVDPAARGLEQLRSELGRRGLSPTEIPRERGRPPAPR